MRKTGYSSTTPLPLEVFREAVEQLPVAISITDASANILYVNRAFESVTGWAGVEAKGRNESILSDKATPKAVYDAMWEAITRGRPWAGVMVNRRKDGHRYVADLTVMPVIDADERILYYLGMHRDITEVHRLEREIRNQKALTETVIDAAPALVALLDIRGRVVIDNHAYKVLMADMGGREPAGAILAAVSHLIGADLGAACAKGQGFNNVEVRIDATGPAEPRWFSCSGAWVREFDKEAASYFEAGQFRDGSHGGLLLVCNEITVQRRRWEQGRTAMVRALMAEQHLVQGMREVLSAALYKLQEPLNLVAAARGILERNLNCDRGLKQVLDEVMRSGNEALDNLKASMPEKAMEATEPLNINELVRDVLDISTERFLREGVVVEWKPKPVLPMVPGRAYAMRMLVKILLDNAVDSFREPGVLDREIRIYSGETADGLVELVIEDSGPGVAEDLRIRVFEPFFSGWRNHRGRAGMGLAVAQQIITDQGGTLRIEDAERPGGCRIRVDLPSRLPSRPPSMAEIEDIP